MLAQEAAAEEPVALDALPRTSVRSDAFSAPRTADELAAMLDGSANLLGGGTDLGLVVTKAHRDLGRLVYLGNVHELKLISEQPEFFELGGAVTYAEAQPVLAALHPDIGELVRRLGGPQVRACGTLAGNIANGSPIGDTMPVLLALNATLILQLGRRARQVRVADFYTGYRESVLRPGEFIRAIRIPKLQPGARFAAYKLSKRFDQDISSICAAFHVDPWGKARFGFGGMAATPARARRTEVAYAKSLDAACAALAEDFNPISDHRASAWYRIRAAQGLVRKFHAGVGPRVLLELRP
jgi:xanthine dehydrogenase small subunit